MPPNMLYLDADNNVVPDRLAEKYEKHAAKYWDMFYSNHADKFFKDRHYFDREFPELLHGAGSLVEVGCGVGNTVFPLLDLNPQLHIYACDFSSRAIQLVKSHPSYASGRVTAFVADITSDDLCNHVLAASADFVTMVFVLSAISPEKMPAAISNVARVLKPGTGRLLFRDYAHGDLAHDRHENNGIKKLSDSFYVRGDGTRCYYFREQELQAMFQAHGLQCVELRIHEREIENRKRQITMHRRWMQAVFVLGTAQQPQTTAVRQDMEMVDATSSQPAGRSWLAGAAGRLASNLVALPGVPSGRAQLPDSLDSADEVAGTLSPGPNSSKAAMDLEAELEREFFETISRDAQEVVAEELAAAGIAGLRLVDPAELALVYPTGDTSISMQEAAAGLDHAANGSGVQQPLIQQDVVVAPHVSFLCRAPAIPSDAGAHASTSAIVSSEELAMAQFLVHRPELVSNKTVVQLGAGPTGVVALTAVRQARRVHATCLDKPALGLLGANIQFNSAKVVVERLRLSQLAWRDQAQVQKLVRHLAPQGADVFVHAAHVASQANLYDMLCTARMLADSCAPSHGRQILPVEQQQQGVMHHSCQGTVQLLLSCCLQSKQEISALGAAAQSAGWKMLPQSNFGGSCWVLTLTICPTPLPGHPS